MLESVKRNWKIHKHLLRQKEQLNPLSKINSTTSITPSPIENSLLSYDYEVALYSYKDKIPTSSSKKAARPRKTEVPVVNDQMYMTIN